MVDRRVVFVGAVVLALVVLSIFGVPPRVLWQKVQEFTSGAGGAASATLKQTETRGERQGEASAVLDGLPGEKKDDWTDPKRRNRN